LDFSRFIYMGQNWHYKYFGVIFSLIIICGYASAELIEVNRVVGRVNDQIITQGEIDLVMNKINLTNTQKQTESQKLIESRIDRLLCAFAFEKKGMALPDSYVESRYNNDLLNKFDGDRLTFRKYLQSEHLTIMDYKEQLKEEIIYMHMLSKRKRTTLETSPQSVEDYYQDNPGKFMSPKKVHLQELLFTVKISPESDKIGSLATKVYKQLKTEEDFSSVSSQYKNCNFTDWKYFVTEDEILDSATRKLAFTLAEGEYSKPFKVKHSEKDAWKILKVLKIQKAEKIPLDKVRISIEKALARQIESDEQRKWLARQKLDAFVDTSF
jgi:parvulin-like peptidyl-prolyl isomerase